MLRGNNNKLPPAAMALCALSATAVFADTITLATFSDPASVGGEFLFERSGHMLIVGWDRTGLIS